MRVILSESGARGKKEKLIAPFNCLVGKGRVESEKEKGKKGCSLLLCLLGCPRGPPASTELSRTSSFPGAIFLKTERETKGEGEERGAIEESSESELGANLL